MIVLVRQRYESRQELQLKFKDVGHRFPYGLEVTICDLQIESAEAVGTVFEIRQSLDHNRTVSYLIKYKKLIVKRLNAGIFLCDQVEGPPPHKNFICLKAISKRLFAICEKARPIVFSTYSAWPSELPAPD